MADHLTLVAVDDDPTSLDLIVAMLEQDGLKIFTETDPVRSLDLIAEKKPQIVISDLMMPGMTGMEVLARVRKLHPGIDVILLTAHYSTESAVEAVQKGATDYLTKPVDTRRLRSRIDGLIAEHRRRQSARRLDSELLEAHRYRGIIGRSPLMLDLFARIERIAPHYRTVLVTGPTGAGKELVARAIHEASPVANGPMVVCNSAAIPETLVESELFGHVKGSFTGATQDKAGLFESAHNGTVLLDEIGELPPAAQAKLLRVVQHQQVQRVGSSTSRPVNVRIIAATHRNLRAMIAERTFRDDLFFRLGMVELRLPALADRMEDLPLLWRYFLDRFSATYNKPLEGFTRKAEIAMMTYSWPGNVRELEGVIGAAAMIAESSVIDVHDLPQHMLNAEPSDAPIPSMPGQATDDCDLTLDQMQVVHAKRVVERLAGDKVRAAEVLGVSRATLYRLLSRT